MVSPSMRRYVVSLEMEGEGRDLAAALMLTRAGIDFGRQGDGSMALARLVMEAPGWTGTRTEKNVAQEIKAHCVTWIFVPPMRTAANPVDIECFQDWPANLMGSVQRRIRLLLRR